MSKDKQVKGLDELIDDGTRKKQNAISSNKLAQNDSETIQDLLNMSTEDIEKLRKEKLEEIDKMIEKLSKDLDVENLDKYVLDNKIQLLEKSKFILDEFMVSVLTHLSSNARAFEVLGQTFKIVSELNDSILKDNSQASVNIKVEGEQSQGKVLQNTNDLIGKMIEINMERKAFQDKTPKKVKVIQNK